MTQIDWVAVKNTSGTGVGELMYSLVAELFPIPRSLTGEGVMVVPMRCTICAVCANCTMARSRNAPTVAEVVTANAS
jgi:hypothetical protein